MPETLIRELQAVGVRLFIQDGRLAFDAPDGVMTNELLARLRDDRDAVLAAMELIKERAAIVEHDGRMSRADAERFAWDELIEQPVEPVPESDEMPVGVHCPFCQCRRFQDEPRGMRCRSCSRLAWLFLANGSVVRADNEKTDLSFDV